MLKKLEKIPLLGATINPDWLDLPLSLTNFHGPKGVRAIEVLLYVVLVSGGWSGGAIMLGKLTMPGHPTIWITVGQGPTALAVGAGGGCLDIFTLIYTFFPLSPSLWQTARYRLKYCLKGPLNPKPTNQPTYNFTSLMQIGKEIYLCSSGPGCLKLTTSLVNVSLKFQKLISQIQQYFLLKNCEKLLQCKSFSHFLNRKYQCICL